MQHPHRHCGKAEVAAVKGQGSRAVTGAGEALQCSRQDDAGAALGMLAVGPFMLRPWHKAVRESAAGLPSVAAAGWVGCGGLTGRGHLKACLDGLRP